MVTSCIILITRLGGLASGRNTQKRLDFLYTSFIAWCKSNHKSSSLDGFSLNKFKMKTSPASSHKRESKLVVNLSVYRAVYTIVYGPLCKIYCVCEVAELPQGHRKGMGHHTSVRVAGGPAL